jgi:hypothetical protein
MLMCTRHCICSTPLAPALQVLLAQRLYWACPFIPYIWAAMPLSQRWVLRIGFEASYCINV